MKRSIALAAVVCLSLGAATAQAATGGAAACKQHSGQLLDALVAGQFQQAGANFNSAMSQKLTPDMLKKIWGILTAKVGPYQSRGMPSASKMKAYNVVTTPMNFKQTPLQAKVTCSADGRVAGLRFVPLNSKGGTANKHS